jgi:methylmalonyl-CoA/ethylmalonyl-CoA epimerase
MKLDHIGIAVHSIEEAESKYKKILGYGCYHYETLPEQKVKAGFIKVGDQKLELLEPLSDNGPIEKFLRKRGPGMHHTAFLVEDIISEMYRLEEEGFRLLDKEPRIGALNKWVCFIHPKDVDGVLIELCQPRKEKE